jgi:hypothetical protein
MPRLRHLIPALFFSLAVAPAIQAKLPSPVPTVQLEPIIVTPQGHYTAQQWQARQAVRLQAVIVTPTARYTPEQWQARQAMLMQAKLPKRTQGIKTWLRTVWRHFKFARSLVSA